MIVFEVYGVPAPQGSKKAFVITDRAGKAAGVNLVESSKKVMPWREAVTWAFIQQSRGVRVAGAARVMIEFRFNRPKSHYRTGRNSHLLKDSAPTLHTSKPDIDKLVRSTLDALTAAGAYADDSCVVSLDVVKRYCNDDESQGATIAIREATTPDVLPDFEKG